MGLNWTNKTDGIDDIMADDVNSLANAITENEEELEKKANFDDVYSKTDTDNKLEDYQTKLTFDAVPANGSDNPVTSDGIRSSLDTKVNKISNAEGYKLVYSDTNGGIFETILYVDDSRIDHLSPYNAVPTKTAVVEYVNRELEPYALKENTYAKSEVYTKTEALDKFVPHNTASGYPITLTDHLADVPPKAFTIYGAAGGVGDLVTSGEYAGKYKINVVISGKNVFNANSWYPNYVNSVGGITYVDTDFAIINNVKILQGKFSENTQYTFSFSYECTNFDSNIVYVDMYNASGTKIATKQVLGSWFTGSASGSFEVSNPSNTSISYMLISYGSTARTANVKLTNMQIAKEGIATPCEPYVAPSQAAVYLDAPLTTDQYVSVMGLSSVNSVVNTISTETVTKPAQITVAYYQDINKVLANIQALVLEK